MAPDAEPPFPDPEAETPPSRRRGIGLCLQGGGGRRNNPGVARGDELRPKSLIVEPGR